MGKAGSVSSAGSNKSSKSGYKTIANGSFVDEALFGSKPGTSKSPSANGTQTKTQTQFKTCETEYKTCETLHKSYDISKGSIKSGKHLVTLTTSDLQRMLASAPDTSAEHLAAMRHDAEERKIQERTASKARKEKMLKLEEEAKKQAPLTESELLKQQTDTAVVSHAEHLMEEEKDEVKHMNHMVQYAKCVAIRDKQILEKKAAMLADEEEQRRLDMQMEVERIKALEAYHARDQQRMEEQRRCAAILKEQRAEREQQRLRQEELQDQERLQLLREMERLKEEEVVAAYERKQRAAALMHEVAQVNAAQISRKQEQRTREQEEEMRIAQYIRQKDAREQALAAEKERIAKEKEMEVARLRGMQEKQADHQSEQDELRARRYQEAKEREWRVKERAAAERQAALMADLAGAREAQMRSKLTMASSMAEVEKAEFNRILEVNKQKEMEQMMQTTAQLQINDAYKRDLLAQIQARHEKQQAERQAYLEEGRKVRQEQAREKARLEQVKQRKLKELEATGVPAKYQADLAKLKI